METILKSIRLTKFVINQIDNEAKEENRSFTNMIQTILVNHYKNKKDN